MDDLIFACNVTDIQTIGSYNYYLYSRIDKYNVILREKNDDTEYRFYVLRESDNVDTIWTSADSQTYKRPDAMAISIKRYVLNKLREFKSATTSVANNNWA